MRTANQRRGANVIDLAGGRAARRARMASAPAATFAFDPTSPFTYLTAERVERRFPGAAWEPVDGAQVLGAAARVTAAVRARAERRAAALGMPLVWPDAPAGAGRAVRRAAAHAAARGRGAAFALAAGRLAFCGGFDLDDPAVLVDAAAAAGLGADVCLAAARDAFWDAPLAIAARRLVVAGVVDLPALTVGGRRFAGEDRVAAAAPR